MWLYHACGGVYHSTQGDSHNFGATQKPKAKHTSSTPTTRRATPSDPSVLSKADLKPTLDVCSYASQLVFMPSTDTLELHPTFRLGFLLASMDTL
jgi:hypothetical protein